MMRNKDLDPLGCVREGTAVGGQHARRLQGGHAPQPFEIFVQRVRCALRVQSDVGRQLRQDVVAREQQAFVCVVQADVSRRVAGRPLDSELARSHLNRLGSVELHGRLRCLDDLAQRTLRVAQHVRLFRGHAVDQEIAPHLVDQLLELDVARIHQRDLEPVDVQVGQSGSAGECARGPVVVGMDVRDHQRAQPLRSEQAQAPADHFDRLVGVHAAVEQVGLLAVGKDEDVDQAVLERDRQAELEDARRDFGQREIDGHRQILVQAAAKMSTERYSNVLKTRRTNSGGSDV